MVDSYEGPKIFFSDQNLQMDDEKTSKISYDDVLRKFKMFIREYQNSGTYIYREELLTNALKNIGSISNKCSGKKPGFQTSVFST